MANIQELLQRSKALKDTIKAKQAELKAQKVSLVAEMQSGLSDTEKEKQVTEAQRILANVKIEADKARAQFKEAIRNLKEKRDYAKELLDFVGYKIANGLPRVTQSIKVENGKVTIHRQDMKADVSVNISNAEWQKELKALLTTQGLDDGQARNICYKAMLQVKASI